jgi:hypothetical protein
MARQPELQGKLQLNMLIGFALIEAQVLRELHLGPRTRALFVREEVREIARGRNGMTENEK